MSDQLLNIVLLVLRILSFAIIGRALLSWFDPSFKSAVGRIIYDVTEPVIGPIRRFVPSMGMFDLSPIIALVLIQVLSRVLVGALS